MPLPPPRPAGARFDVVGLGEISVDDVLLVEGAGAVGSKTRVLRRERIGGGQVATAMVALCRLGLRTAVIGAVGDDEAGRFAVEGLRAEGVDVGGIQVMDAATRQAVVVINAHGDRTVLAIDDPRLDLGDAAATTDLIREARVLHIDDSYRAAAIAAARVAREHGVFVSCDLDTDRGAATDELLALVDLCVVPGQFLADMIGKTTRPLRDRNLPALVAERTASRVACVTRGEQGATVVENGGTGAERVFDQPAFHVEPVVDTTACGDTFRAGFIAAHLDGRDLRGCLRFACAAAALKVRDLGRRGCPSRAAVEALVAEAA